MSIRKSAGRLFWGRTRCKRAEQRQGLLSRRVASRGRVGVQRLVGRPESQLVVQLVSPAQRDQPERVKAPWERLPQRLRFGPGAPGCPAAAAEGRCWPWLWLWLRRAAACWPSEHGLALRQLHHLRQAVGLGWCHPWHGYRQPACAPQPGVFQDRRCARAEPCRTGRRACRAGEQQAVVARLMDRRCFCFVRSGWSQQ